MNFVWTLILSPWVGLVVLILYDATKNDGNGRTKTVAAGNFKMFIERIALIASGSVIFRLAPEVIIGRPNGSRRCKERAAAKGRSSFGDYPRSRVSDHGSR
jgi:hypothetical protein